MSAPTEKELFIKDTLEYVAGYYRDEEGNIKEINKVVDITNAIMDSYDEILKIKRELWG